MLVININRKVALVLLAVYAVFYVYSFQFPPEVMVFPRFLLVSLTIMTLLLFIFPGELGEVKVTGFLAKPKLITAAFIVGYVALFPVVGFFVTTFLTVFTYILTFERKVWLKAFLISLGWVAVLYVVFQKLLFIWFPAGLII